MDPDVSQVNVPADLALLSEHELETLLTDVDGEFDGLRDSDNVTPDTLQRMEELADHHDRVGSALTGRRAEREAAETSRQASLEEQRQRLATRVHGPSEPEPVTEPVATGLPDVDAIAAAAARGTTAALITVFGNNRRNGGPGPADITPDAGERAASLTAAQRHAPAVAAPTARPAVTAGVEIPGLPSGTELSDIDAMATALRKRARGVPLTNMGPSAAQGGSPALSIRNTFEHTVDDRTSMSQVEDLLRHITRAEKRESLVAGGGWCAPSENRYEFFNIADVDGLIDLPTFGVSRGGIRYPTSPSMADVFINAPATGLGGFSATFGNQSVPWLWTEETDILTVTGTTNKPALRVPCPSFSEDRLECYGITLTAGNLADDAYPEATQNFLRLLLAAHAHAINGRILALMVAKSAAATTGGDYGTATNPAFQQFLGGLSLAATDYRARYGMRSDAILEAVVPYWVAAAIQSDLAWRTGTDQLLSVTLAEINSYFADRGVRVQWVGDWQVRASGQFGHATAMTNWPVTADVMLYAAGTFVLGNGLSLDLGVVRDSVLNAENDHTAAWSEECHLVAKVGHESRLYRVQFNVNGGTNMTSPTGAPFL